MKLPMLVGAFAIATLSLPAAAVPLKFTVSGDYSAEFILDSVPTAEYVADSYSFSISHVAGFAGTASGFADLTFFNGGVTGGVLITDPDDPFNWLLDANGAQLYGGTEANPVFAAGASFALTGLGTLGNFTVSIAAVPEPAGWMLMIGGVGVIGATMRSRRKVRVRYAA